MLKTRQQLAYKILQTVNTIAREQGQNREYELGLLAGELARILAEDPILRKQFWNHLEHVRQCNK